MRQLIEVVTAAEAAARDGATIAAGIPSRALMGRAGAAAAAEIARRFPEQLKRGVLVIAGPGNNGGDGWVIARALAAAGSAVRVVAPLGTKSPNCIAERNDALPWVAEVEASPTGSYAGEGIVVDALFGTGVRKEPVGRALDDLWRTRKAGGVAVAVDLPTGLDPTTGIGSLYQADLTITFGTIKRGHLIGRGICGQIVVVDIGLHSHPEHAVRLVDSRWVRSHVPLIAANAHKGTRGKLVVHGGQLGMAGAVILAARAALRSGIGMVKARVDPRVADAIHQGVPEALVDHRPGPATSDGWADVLVIGPGMGLREQSDVEVGAAVATHGGPVIIDADALNAFEGRRSALRKLLVGHHAILTPHVVELGRLAGLSPGMVIADPFAASAELARDTGAIVLLKGVPTIISAPDGRQLVVATGTPSLATAGSGDVLSGVIGAVAAQVDDPFIAAACGAWIHGRAAELAGTTIRGTALPDIMEALPAAWSEEPSPPVYPALAELPMVPSR